MLRAGSPTKAMNGKTMTPLCIYAVLSTGLLTYGILALSPTLLGSLRLHILESNTSTTPFNKTIEAYFSCFPRSHRDPPVTWVTCQPTLDHILRQPDAFEEHVYGETTGKPIHFSGPPCMVMLGSWISDAEITISKQQVVNYARYILDACRPINGGGFWNVNSRWYVAVKGADPDLSNASGLWRGPNET